jgi:hypothetical protein
MAPEWFDSDSRVPLGPAADVFAWGAVIGYAGCGRTPFEADSASATAARILTRPPDLTGLPQPMQDLVEGALAKEPADRPTARELLDRLLDGGSSPAVARAAFDGRPELRAAAQNAREFPNNGDFAQVAGFEETDVRPRRRGARLWTMVAAAAAVVLAAAGTWYLTGHVKAPTVPAAQIQPSSNAAPPVRTSVDIKDPLTEQKGWLSRDDEEGSCVFRDQRMSVTLKHLGHTLCPGPDDVLVGDQLIAVDVIRSKAEECGSIFFLIKDEGYYELVTCGDKLVVNRSDPTSELLILAGAFNLENALPVDKPVRVEVRLTGFRLVVRLDDREVGQMLLDSETVKRGGQVTLGAFGTPPKQPPFTVAFARFEARTLR